MCPSIWILDNYHVYHLSVETQCPHDHKYRGKSLVDKWTMVMQLINGLKIRVLDQIRGHADGL